METNNNQFSALRFKVDTIAEYRRVKLATEASLGHEITHDEFMKHLIKKAMADILIK